MAECLYGVYIRTYLHGVNRCYVCLQLADLYAYLPLPLLPALWLKTGGSGGGGVVVIGGCVGGSD